MNKQVIIDRNKHLKGGIMHMRRITFTAVIIVFIITIAATITHADQLQSFINPNRILKGTTPTITITLDKNIPNWQKITNVRVAGQVITVPPPGTDAKLSVLLPKLDIAGSADIEVIGADNKSVVVGQLYVQSAERSFNRLSLLLIYIFIIAFPPALFTWYDIKKSYAERYKVLQHHLTEKTTIEEKQALLMTMDQGPTGLAGLTRGIIAVTITVALAIAVFHLIVFAAVDLSKITEQLLTMLAATLTAITGFYFGSKASTEAAAKATTPADPGTGKNGGSVMPKITKLDPPDKVAVNNVLKVIGEGFGNQQGGGTVTFTSKNGNVRKDGTVDKDDWTDTLIKVTVPDGLHSGPVNVVVTNDKGDSSASMSLTIN